jgi:signal peptidase II
MDDNPTLSGEGAHPKYVTLAITFVLILVLDLVTKFLVQSSLAINDSIPILGDTVRLTYILNPNGAFGMSVGSNAFRIATSVAVIAAVIGFFRRELGRSLLIDLSVGAILAGAVGNLIDRLRLGEVVDFVDVDIPDVDFISIHLDRWPIFNVADSALTAGMILLVAAMLISGIKKSS